MKTRLLLFIIPVLFTCGCSQSVNLNRVKGIIGPNAPIISEKGVLFKILAPEAVLVTIAGNFNGWNSLTTPLDKSTNGIWSILLPLPKGQKYYYKFVVDGYWIADPDNPDTENASGSGVLSIVNVK